MLNLGKTQFLLFKSSNKVTLFSINIDNIAIHPTTTSKFLGVTLDDKLDWMPQINERLLKIKRNKNMLQLTKKCLNPASRKLVYYGHIHSHLTYCLMVWGSLGKKCDITRLIKAQNKCVKLIDPAMELSMIYKKYRILKLAK